MKIVVAEDHIALQGVLNYASASDVRSTLHEVIESTYGPLVLDASRLIIADATGLGVLLGVFRRLQGRARQLTLSNPSIGVRHLLARTGMHDDIQITHDLRTVENQCVQLPHGERQRKLAS